MVLPGMRVVVLCSIWTAKRIKRKITLLEKIDEIEKIYETNRNELR